MAEDDKTIAEALQQNLSVNDRVEAIGYPQVIDAMAAQIDSNHDHRFSKEEMIAYARTLGAATHFQDTIVTGPDGHVVKNADGSIKITSGEQLESYARRQLATLESLPTPEQWDARLNAATTAEAKLAILNDLKKSLLDHTEAYAADPAIAAGVELFKSAGGGFQVIAQALPKLLPKERDEFLNGYIDEDADDAKEQRAAVVAVINDLAKYDFEHIDAPTLKELYASPVPTPAPAKDASAPPVAKDTTPSR